MAVSRIPEGLVFASLMCGHVLQVPTCEMDECQRHGDGQRVNPSGQARCVDSLRVRHSATARKNKKSTPKYY